MYQVFRDGNTMLRGQYPGEEYPNPNPTTTVYVEFADEKLIDSIRSFPKYVALHTRIQQDLTAIVQAAVQNWFARNNVWCRSGEFSISVYPARADGFGTENVRIIRLPLPSAPIPGGIELPATNADLTFYLHAFMKTGYLLQVGSVPPNRMFVVKQYQFNIPTDLSNAFTEIGEGIQHLSERLRMRMREIAQVQRLNMMKSVMGERAQMAMDIFVMNQFPYERLTQISLALGIPPKSEYTTQEATRLMISALLDPMIPI